MASAATMGRVEAEEPITVGGRHVDRSMLADVCERFGVVELAVFGAVVRGEEGPDSDVDLLYVAAPEARLGFALNRLEDELAALFGRRVDLVSRKALHRLIRDEVEREARTLYAA